MEPGRGRSGVERGQTGLWHLVGAELGVCRDWIPRRNLRTFLVGFLSCEELGMKVGKDHVGCISISISILLLLVLLL